MTETTTTAAGNLPGRPGPATRTAEQLAALEALVLLGRGYAHLPAADFRVGRIYPDTVTVHVFDGLDAFEAWREALRIPEADVDHHVYEGQLTLTARTRVAGAMVDLVGYAPALPEQAGGELA